MLMKEFKSAHSRMFSKRRDTTNSSALKCEPAKVDQPASTSGGDATSAAAAAAAAATAASGAIKTLNTRKLGLLAQPRLHLAAAN